MVVVVVVVVEVTNKKVDCITHFVHLANILLKEFARHLEYEEKQLLLIMAALCSRCGHYIFAL